MDEEQTAIASQMWKEGYTAAQIATRFGVTRQVVVGKASRNRDRFPARKDNTGPHEQVVAAAVAMKAVKERFPPKAPGYNGIPVGKLTVCGCTFPLWGDHERYDVKTSLWCGAPKSERGGPYCGFHARASAGAGTRSERDASRALLRVA